MEVDVKGKKRSRSYIWHHNCFRSNCGAIYIYAASALLLSQTEPAYRLDHSWARGHRLLPVAIQPYVALVCCSSGLHLRNPFKSMDYTNLLTQKGWKAELAQLAYHWWTVYPPASHRSGTGQGMPAGQRLASSNHWVWHVTTLVICREDISGFVLWHTKKSWKRSPVGYLNRPVAPR